jgi:hypothetical protein
MTPYPILIVSYNRPHYLRQLVASLGPALDRPAQRGRPVVLFQDSAHSSYFGRDKTDPALIEECRAVFRDAFPTAPIVDADANLGIAANIDRAERWAFVDHDWPAAVVFEDDLVVAPRYFDAMDALLALADADERIGMVAAYGSNAVASIAGQGAGRRRLGRMHHNWGYGITRRHWLERDRLVRPYLDAIRPYDYMDRPYAPVLDFYRRHGLPALASNQDLFKNLATMLLGRARLASVTVNARYIGDHGEHFTPEMYASIGFDRTNVFDYGEEPIGFDPPGEAELADILQAERRELMKKRVDAAFQVSQGIHVDPLRADNPHLAAVVERGGVRFHCPGGFYHDGWAKAHVRIPFAADAPVTSVRVRGRVFPQGFKLWQPFRLTVEGPGVKRTHAILAAPEFDVQAPLTGDAEGGIHLVEVRTRPVQSPHGLGLGPERRALSWHLGSIEVTTAAGTAQFLAADLPGLVRATEATFEADGAARRSAA